jgi:hypothetical protein
MKASSLILRRRYAATALITLVFSVMALSSLSAWRTGQHARHLNALIQSGLGDGFVLLHRHIEDFDYQAALVDLIHAADAAQINLN